MSEQRLSFLHFTGHKHLISRLLLSTLTGRPIRISKIRASSLSSPGLLPHEVSFVRLLEAITNGSVIQFSATGMTLEYRPGLITGSAPGLGAGQGGVVEHWVGEECTRGVSWFLVPLCVLAPFSKEKVAVCFKGPGVITSATETGDVSVDTVRTAVLPVMREFCKNKLLDVEVKVLQRSCAGRGGRGGGGEVVLRFGTRWTLPETLHLMSPGRVKNIRGVAYATGLGSSMCHRMIEEARGVLNTLCPDTRIALEASPAPFLPQTDRSAPKRKTGVGFGLALVAESSTGVRFSADVVSPPEGGAVPEDLGKQCAYQLLEAISVGGCVSSVNAPTVLTLMATGSQDAGRLRIGRDVIGSEEIISLGRDLRTFGGSGWGLRDADDESDDILVTVVGRGVGNVGRKLA